MRTLGHSCALSEPQFAACDMEMINLTLEAFAGEGLQLLNKQ
jgi:hypothetical protein